MKYRENQRQLLMIKKHDNELVSCRIGNYTKSDLEKLSDDQRSLPGKFICLYDLKNKVFFPLDNHKPPYEITIEVKELISRTESEYHAG